jgi:hypothetical protein
MKSSSSQLVSTKGQLYLSFPLSKVSLATVLTHENRIGYKGLPVTINKHSSLLQTYVNETARLKNINIFWKLTFNLT